MSNKPTLEFYNLFECVYEHYNNILFNSMLKSPLITITRKSTVAGYYSPRRWTNFSRTNIVDEISINPEIFSINPIDEICQTLVHEMCHQWQHNFGKPSRAGYHNKEWADKMEEVGLMPSTTGKEGGNKTGQSMSDYIIHKGVFEIATNELKEKEIFKNLYFETKNSFDEKKLDETPYNNYESSSPDVIESLSEENYNSFQINNISYEQVSSGNKNKNRVKYTCETCGTNVWGKPDIKIICGECKNNYKEINLKNL